jgi:hypothetical protein
MRLAETRRYMFEQIMRTAPIKKSILIFSVVLCCLYLYLFFATLYDLYFPIEGRFCATPQVSAIIGLAIFIGPISIILAFVSRRWALDIKSCQTISRYAINSFHLLTGIILLVNWFFAWSL